MEGSAPLPMDASAGVDFDALLARPGASLLVLAPHPDDESLAAGGLIQRAHARGVPVSVAFATDGENNPWPQRALERRAWIGPRQRTAWGARRRGEADAALDILEVDPGRVHRLGWPDGGVTWRMLGQMPAMLEALLSVLAREQPTLVVMPAIADRHPDHGALHVLMDFATRALPAGQRPDCFGYLLHGAPGPLQQSRAVLPLTGAEVARKRRAIEAHASQMALGRRRFLRFARATEEFVVGWGQGGAQGLQLPWVPASALRACLSLIVVDAHGGTCLALDGGDGGLRWRDGSAAARLPRQMESPFYAKLFCRVPSPWVFDRWGWCRLDATTA